MRHLSRFLLLAALLACALQAHTQVVEPTFSNQYNVLQEGKLMPLERATGVAQTESHSFLVITPNSKTYQSFPGPSSPIRVGPDAHFILKMTFGDQDPSTIIKLHKLVSTKKDRELIGITVKGSLLPMLGPKVKNTRNDALPVRVQKYGEHSYEIIPEQPLEPGEYGFGFGSELQCFGVDAGGAATGTHSTDVASAQAALPVHRAPQHPKSTDRDLPPAAPGLPPMHADSDAADGCWWAPYYSASLGLEFAYQQCPIDSSMGAHVTISERGNTVLSGIPVDPDAVAQLRKTAGEAAAQSFVADNTHELFKVRNKGAGETVEAAVKQQIILHFKDPASRTGCVAKREVDSATQHATVSIVAVGPYAKRKTHPLGLGGAECDGYSMTGDGEVSTQFWDTTPGNQTHFVEITTAPDSPIFAPETIHFQTAQPLNPGASSKGIAPTSVHGTPSNAGEPQANTAWRNQSGFPNTTAPTEASAAPATLPSAHRSTVDKISRLNIRGITVRMTREQVIAAAQTAQMTASNSSGNNITFTDGTANGAYAGGGAPTGSGLIIQVTFTNDLSSSVLVREAGDLRGNIFADIQKKWGPPVGKGRNGPFWGETNGIYAFYNQNLYSAVGMAILIQDHTQDAPPPARRAPSL